MSSLNSALVRAKKLVSEINKKNNVNANQLFVCTEYNKELSGELVIILYTDKDTS